eukprot:3934403-Amphidinium_carterae.1
MRIIASARDDLLGSVLCVKDAQGNMLYYLIVLAIQSPMTLDLVPLRRLSCRVRARQPMAGFAPACISYLGL